MSKHHYIDDQWSLHVNQCYVTGRRHKIVMTTHTHCHVTMENPEMTFWSLWISEHDHELLCKQQITILDTNSDYYLISSRTQPLETLGEVKTRLPLRLHVTESHCNTHGSGKQVKNLQLLYLFFRFFSLAAKMHFHVICNYVEIYRLW